MPTPSVWKSSTASPRRPAEISAATMENSYPQTKKSVDELASYLAAVKQPGVERWVVLEPLPRSRFDFETRLADLVNREIELSLFFLKHGCPG